MSRLRVTPLEFFGLRSSLRFLSSRVADATVRGVLRLLLVTKKCVPNQRNFFGPILIGNFQRFRDLACHDRQNARSAGSGSLKRTFRSNVERLCAYV